MPTATAVHHRWSDVPSERLTASIARKFITADRMTVARFELTRGGVVPRHSHESEQLTCVMSGSLTFKFDGQQIIVRQGEVLQIPAWAEHEVEVTEDAVAIDVFSPVRQDWVDKTDDYFQKPR